MTDIPEANDDIDAVAAFPAEPDVSAGFPSKAPLKILLGFRNNGDVPVNVTHIAASLNVPQMVSFYVTNFTVQTPLVTVEPGKEASFEYPFVLDPAAGHDSSSPRRRLRRRRREIRQHVLQRHHLRPRPAGVRRQTPKSVLLRSGSAKAPGDGRRRCPPPRRRSRRAGAGKAPAKKRKPDGGAAAADNEWLKGTPGRREPQMDAEVRRRRRDVFADGERETHTHTHTHTHTSMDETSTRSRSFAFTYSSFIIRARRAVRAEPYSIHLVTSWMAFASLATVEDVTPAMEMRPFCHVDVVLLAQLVHLLAGQAGEAEHANLVGDVVPRKRPTRRRARRAGACACQ